MIAHAPHDGANPGSFRDPDGFTFRHQGELLRQVNESYASHYDKLFSCGLYAELVRHGHLISHDEVDRGTDVCSGWKLIRPEEVPFISYPYEWSFSQLKDAALLTLEIQQRALTRGMTLKDASAYNVQFLRGKPVFIDTLSFAQLQPDRPWQAYRQFCQHFLAPLALMAKVDVGLLQLMRTSIDGVPLTTAAKLLPVRTRLSWSLGWHIHLHARTQTRHADRILDAPTRSGSFSRTSFMALIASLRKAVDALEWKPVGTEWQAYYDRDHNYDEQGLAAKDMIVEEYLARARSEVIWDLGANTGRYSRIAARHSKLVCAWDSDPACVEINYQQVRRDGEAGVLPLLIDLANPSPAIGWQNRERTSLMDRAPVDTVLALGLVHHLAISNNLPLAMIAEFLACAGNRLIIEFIPKTDSQVRRLLQSREDIFHQYDRKHFEEALSARFRLIESRDIPGTERSLYFYEATR